MPRPRNAVGERHGRLVITADEGMLNGSHMVRARCDCGTEKSFYLFNILSGKSLSCGCATLEANAKRMTTHGQSKTAVYYVWYTMRKRCSVPSSKSYKDYGGRGIRVCDRWQKFENFLADMGPRPTPAHTIERNNNDGNYEPENCRWATRAEQAKNKRPKARAA